MIKKAFTLIELLVVIAIIGILSGLIIIGMNGMTQKATIAKSQVFSNSLRNALMINTISDWRMDEGSGQSSIDVWGGANAILGSTAGVDANDPIWVSADCIRGSCLQFDGGTTYLTINDNSDIRLNGDFTIEFWAKRTGTTTGSCCPGIIKKGSSWDANGYLIYYSESGDYVSFKRNAIETSWGTPFPLGADWKYFAMTYRNESSQVIFYANGVQVKTWTISFPTNAGTTVLNIGYGDSRSINGLIDEVRLYKTSISAHEIKNNYYSGLINLLVKKQITPEGYVSIIKENILSKR